LSFFIPYAIFARGIGTICRQYLPADDSLNNMERNDYNDKGMQHNNSGGNIVTVKGTGHFLAAILTMWVYGGQVCPLVETLSLSSWFLELTVIFALFFALRKIFYNWIMGRIPFQNQVAHQFGWDFFFFIAIGITIAVVNKSIYGFPEIESGLKMILGTLTLGFFIAVDMALHRERVIADELSAKGLDLRIDRKLFPMVKKFTIISTSLCIIAAAVTLLVVLKDLGWMMHVATIDIKAAQTAVIKEISFVAAVFLCHIVNLIHSYAKNIDLAVRTENTALIGVAGGNLSIHVPVSRNDEFGVMAQYTNTMISELRQKTKEIQDTRDVTIIALASLAETRDNETGGHLLRTQEYVKALAVNLRSHPQYQADLDDTAIDLLYKSAPLHDIGKVGIPDSILLKPGKLSDEEFEIMKTHTSLGVEALRGAAAHLEANNFLQVAQDLICSHHEKWDGNGYPQGLRGVAIPLAGRIMAVADVYDALICKRVYKEAFSHEKAKSIIVDGKGSHFDPNQSRCFSGNRARVY
jgi:response regulator RpfG family c-di-GMP phosphodiesterase